MSIALSGSALFGMLLSKYITYCIQHYSLAFAYQTVALMMFVGGVLLIGILVKESPESMGLKALGADLPLAKLDDKPTEKLALVNLEPKVLKKSHFLVHACCAISGGLCRWWHCLCNFQCTCKILLVWNRPRLF